MSTPSTTPSDSARRKPGHAHEFSESLGLFFSNIHVVGRGSPLKDYQRTLGSIFNPFTLVRDVTDWFYPSTQSIISNFSGVVKPGEMLLVLGRPKAGCTTLLKVLANHRNEYHRVDGAIHYGTFSTNEVSKLYRGDVQYCGQDDDHFSPLTVEQTIGFAARLRAPNTRDGKAALDSYCNSAVSYIIERLGLEHARRTMLGDALIRGVSGGEKRRVSLAEVMVSRPRVACWDNATRGLDSSNAVDFIETLRQMTTSDQLTTVVSLYQAGEPLYLSFDKVCVLYEGHMVYFGPANLAKKYFVDMGYVCPLRQTTADFLVTVTDPNARTVRVGATSIPNTPVQFERYFSESPLGEANRAEMQSYYSEHVQSEEKRAHYIQHDMMERGGRGGTAYIAPLLTQAKAATWRRAQMLRGNMLAVGLSLYSFVFQGVVMGTLFLKTSDSTSAFFSRGGILFFALLFSTLMAFAEIPTLYYQRRVIVKQQRAALCPPWIEALAFTIVDLPPTFISVMLFSVILYFLTGLQRSASQFFIYFLFIFCIAITMKLWFRMIAAAFTSGDVATSFAGLSLLICSIYTGYYIPMPSMIGALRWITWINPFHYGFEATTTNEFRTLQGACSVLIPAGPAYHNITLANQVCTTVGSLPGQPFVQGSRYLELSFGFSFNHVWRNLGIIFAFGTAFLIGLLTFSEVNTTLSTTHSVTLFRRTSKRRPSGPDEEMGASREKASADGLPPMLAYPKPGLINPTILKGAERAFSFVDISYSVPVPNQQDRQLLNKISGSVAPGKLTALMGVSGAGKTTLLNVLALRHDRGARQGAQYIGSQSLPADYNNHVGYCEQIDVHLEMATIREALLFSARLRQPYDTSDAEKELYVDHCLDMCGLSSHSEAIVGSLGLELRKRTSIAVELAAKPSFLLFLDEPTSGLDSQSAFSIIMLLRKLADLGQAILCTIHQPSAELFQLFDKLLLLQNGGEMAYFGDLGSDASTVIGYFERSGARKCGSRENPAEYLLSLTRDRSSDPSWSDAWRESHENRQLREELERLRTHSSQASSIPKGKQSGAFATPWVFQLIQLLKRNLEANWRNPSYLLSKFVLNLGGGLLMGFTFFRAEDTLQGTQNKLFATFMATMICGPVCLQIQGIFINMRSLYNLREKPNGMYTWSAFTTSLVLAELPWNILGSFLYFVSSYWTMGFPTSKAGFTFLLYCVVFPLYYTTLAQVCAAMAPNVELAALIFTFIFSFIITFNGVLQPFSRLNWWKWMYRVSPLTYVIEGFLGNVLSGQPITCSDIEFVEINPIPGQTCQQYMSSYISTLGGYLRNPNDTSLCQFCQTNSADAVLSASFNIRPSRHWIDLGLVLAFVSFNLAILYVLVYLSGGPISIPKLTTYHRSNASPDHEPKSQSLEG